MDHTGREESAVRGPLPRMEEVPVSFGGDPDRDDGLPPTNFVVPDDARELDRDLLAYRREQRARRRRERLLRLIRPLRRYGQGGHGTILPVIAICVALALLAGTMLSVVSIGPAPGSSPAPVPTTPLPAGLTELPPGNFSVDGVGEPVRVLRSAALALIPPSCACDRGLRQLAGEANTAHIGLYFVGEGAAIPQIGALTTRDGSRVAVAAADSGNVLGAAYRPSGLTVLLIYSDSTALVRRNLPADFQFGPDLRALAHPGR